MSEPGTTVTDGFFSAIRSLVDTLRRTQSGSVEKAGQIMADCVERGGVIHVFGAGHSHMLAEEMFWRAGGLAAVDPILDESCMLHHGVARQTTFERLPGSAEAVLASHELRPGDVMIVVSSSGKNAAPVEVAQRAKREGLPLIALTSAGGDCSWAPCSGEDQASWRGPRHSENVLARVADVVLDNCGLAGDAAFPVGAGSPEGRECPGVPAGPEERACPTSTIAGAILLQACVYATVRILVARGLRAPLLTSANVTGGIERNESLRARYRDRVRLL